MTDKKEFEKLFKNSLWSDADSLAIKMEDTVYQWHIQQQIKLLEEVKKEIIKYGNRDTNEYEGGKLYVIENVCEDLDSKITNLKEK